MSRRGYAGMPLMVEEELAHAADALSARVRRALAEADEPALVVAVAANTYGRLLSVARELYPDDAALAALEPSEPGATSMLDLAQAVGRMSDALRARVPACPDEPRDQASAPPAMQSSR